MKLHPRYFATSQASLDIGESIIQAIQKHELTSLELVRILLNEAQKWNTNALRDERHPDSNGQKKADEA
jgi:hypothetical protein